MLAGEPRQPCERHAPPFCPPISASEWSALTIDGVRNPWSVTVRRGVCAVVLIPQVASPYLSSFRIVREVSSKRLSPAITGK